MRGGNPTRTNSVSVATMRITPMVIVAMTAIRLNAGRSSLKKNAKTRTNASVDDLQSAAS